jgi:hypothetical protein
MASKIFKTYEGALNYAAKLRAKGYNAHVWGTSKPWKVIYSKRNK